VCPTCGAGQQRASGELVPVGAEVVAMAQCDGQQLGHVPPRAANQNAALGLDVTASSDSSNAPVGVDATSGLRVHEMPQGGVESASLSTPIKQPPFGSARVDARAPASVACDARPHPHPRAKQGIPPALRRAVLLRDQHRCQVPGCRNTTFLDLHHIQLRSEGGRHELENMLTICGCHHRATHRGSLLIEKDAEGGVVFRHADGSVYGHALEPPALQAQAKLFSALRHLGFKEREVRAALAQLRADPGLRGASLQHQLREALRRLHPPQPRP
jgi:Holliday junction resolvase RuvA-like protein